MKLTIYIFIFLALLIPKTLLAQTETYKISKASFSSDKYDEFCPVYYKNGIVFCTNRSTNSLSSYSESDDKGQFKIFYIDTVGKVTWQQSGLFSKDLTTRLNDGPVTFNLTGDTVYYSRNLIVDGSLKNLSGPRNKLGIFYSVFDGKRWTKIRDFRFNNEWYNVTTPCLSKDGKRLFFASDKPDGYGGFDLYFCDWKDGYWDNPVNMGPNINTTGNEIYPFVNQSDEIYFSSDGHQGFGKKDIFYSRKIGDEWQLPVGLDSFINSSFDDFGLVTDELMNEGYFSSKRGNSIDIYRFNTNVHQIFYAKKQKENQYCFLFNDESSMLANNNNFQYKWEFGDGTSAIGQSTTHCYAGPGNYSVKLNIVDKISGMQFFTKLFYELDLKAIEQPYINSPDISVKGKVIQIDGLRSNLPGCNIIDYVWEFGDGEAGRGERLEHIFNYKGEYEIKLELFLKETASGRLRRESVSKNILILDDEKEMAAYQVKTKQKPNPINIKEYEQAFIDTVYCADNDLIKGALFNVEIINSKIKLEPGDPVFKKVSSNYRIKEIFNKEEGSYGYIVDSKLNLAETWLTYKEFKSLGFGNTEIKTYILSDPAEKELLNLKKIYGLSSDTYFDNYNRLTSSAYLLLDQSYKLMVRYPGIKIEIEVHTDNRLQTQNNLVLSQQRAQLFVNYLVGKGIDIKRLRAIGKGSTRPVAPNDNDAGKKLNRRIDLIIIH
jgi:outer membrane protein OmpA-like peptidoglycan-associated protein